MIEYLIDANIFFRIFKNDLLVKQLVENLDAGICATVYIECLQGSKSNKDKRDIQLYLDNFSLLQITPDISARAIDLIITYSNSHGLLLADALIAATALENDLTVVTYNVDDFKFIKDLKYVKPTV